MTEARPAFLRPFLMLVLLGAMGASTLLITADDLLASIPAAQVAGAGGPVAVKVAMLIQPVILTALAVAAGLLTAWVFRSNVTGRFGIVTARFGPT